MYFSKFQFWNGTKLLLCCLKWNSVKSPDWARHKVSLFTLVILYSINKYPFHIEVLYGTPERWQIYRCHIMQKVNQHPAVVLLWFVKTGHICSQLLLIVSNVYIFRENTGTYRWRNRKCRHMWWAHVCLLCVWFCSRSLHGALEETTDAAQLRLGPDRLRRGGGGEITPKITALFFFERFTSYTSVYMCWKHHWTLWVIWLLSHSLNSQS